MRIFVQHFCGNIRIFVSTTCFVLPLSTLCCLLEISKCLWHWRWRSSESFALKAVQNLNGVIYGNRMWLDMAHSERFLWFSIVVVRNLKLDLYGVYLLRFIISQRRCVNTGDNAKLDQLLIGTWTRLLAGRKRGADFAVKSIQQASRINPFEKIDIIILLYFLHVIDDIWNNIYVVVVSNL